MKNFFRKFTICIAVCAALFCQNTSTIYAAVDNDVAYPISSNDISGWPQMGDMYSETAVLMDADTGAILVNKGMDAQRYPASITKIMTTYLALENCQLSDQVTFTEEGLARMSEGTNINSQVGEVLTLEQCLNVIMMVSANEVATQVAIHVAGSEAAFAEMMNTKATELGCTNTHFANASGLPDENHYTSAHDMALIFRAALQNEEFINIISQLTYTLPATNMNPEARAYSTHLPLRSPAAPEYYESCIGGKTGVTTVARNTLVTAATRDDTTLIAVTLRADAGQVCADSTAMYEYGFNNFEKREIDGGSILVPAGVSDDSLTIEESEQDGQTIQTYSYEGQYLGTGIKVEEEIEEAEETPVVTIPIEDSATANNPMLNSRNFAIIVGVLGGLIIFGIIMIIVKAISNLKNR